MNIRDMAIVLPLASDDQLVSSAVLVSQKDGFPIFVSTLHQLGASTNYKIAIPPHLGDISASQRYPLQETAAIEIDLVKIDPAHDLAIFKGRTTDFRAAFPKIHTQFNEISVGEELVVVGYPYSTLGSFLETAQITNVSAKGVRLFMDTLEIKELIISHQTLQGSSGSAVIRRSDGALCGILRGTLAPPSVVSIGNIPLASDTNVTYVTYSSILPNLLSTI
ncbi:trypsin-like peptidase domain-containing protein [Litoribacter ruber]|uniref:trypsin-like peptidase domain-containing protein n=1 Tax=Litoribacter ruber TaxID=702568 RepID=UPI001BDB23BD|nr:trypsin-like peptidase domain-containing protein [Litoribacter ruber]MBT0810141.1 trypsin-like peptidase domain-containing protein [Litoribacter ruber]